MPVKYIPYFPNTVEGQAILNNFVRTRRALQYRDNAQVFTKIKRGMPYYEVEKIEEVRSNSSPFGGGREGANMLIRGECISACAYLKEKGIKIDLVYIDPPFASGADYAKKIYIRRNPKVAAAIKKAEEEMEMDDLKAFEEKMYGDIWNKEAYLNWMYENLMAIKSVMSETASIYVHLDWHIGHYVKVLMDEIFGEDNFQNEIIWKRTTSKAGSKYYNHIHDTIYFYTVGEETNWNQLYTEYTEEYITQMFKNQDNDGRKWRESPLTAPGKTSGSSGETWKGVNPGNIGKGRHWAIPGYIRKNLSLNAQKNTIVALDELDTSGRIIWSKGGMPNFKQYIDDMEGIEIQSIWIDIGGNGNDVEYETQKPDTLLERIIKAGSNEKMLVADFFGGSGVTAKIAHALKRNFIHCDVGANSVQTTRDRLISVKAEFDILEIKDGVNLFRNPVQTMDKLKKMILGLRNEDKLDKFWEGAITESKNGTIPVYLPNLLDHTTKVLDIPLMNRVINEAVPDLPDSVKKVIVYYIDIDDEKELRKFIKEQNVLVEIELRDLKEILDDVIVDDIAEYKVKEKSGEYEIEFTKFISDRLRQKIEEYNQKGLMQPLTAREEENGNGNGNENGDNGKNGNGKEKKKFTSIEISKDGLELIELISLDCKNKDGKIWHSDREIKIDKLGYVIEDGKKTKTFWNVKISCKKKPLRMKVRNIAGDEIIISLTEEKKETKY